MKKEKIKNMVSMKEVLGHYGIEKKSKNQYWCPRHPDKEGDKPSLVLYPESQTVSCLSRGCFEGDDIFGVIAKIEGLDLKKEFKKVLKKASTIEGGLNFKRKGSPKPSDPKKVNTYHNSLPPKIKIYLEKRGINEAVIDKHKLGWTGRAISIPIFNEKGDFLFFKYRKGPDQRSENKYWCDKNSSHTLYGWENIKKSKEPLLICEGELDRLVLESKGFQAVTSTGGAKFFKVGWAEKIKETGREIYVCLDRDEAGRKGTLKIAKLLPNARLVVLPEKIEGKDVTDFFQEGGTKETFQALMKESRSLGDFKSAQEEKRIRDLLTQDRFEEISFKGLKEVLGLNIKKDNTNKLITFFAFLSAYTESSQINVTFNGPSSIGKSYIPLQIASLFPSDDVKTVGYSSPTAFFHDHGGYNKEIEGYKTDLERKILIFLDQPHNQLLERLRPILSHDKKTIKHKITDRKKRHGLQTKNIYIVGFPAVAFCTARLTVDEQEATRFILLTPETSQEKIRAAVIERAKKEADPGTYKDWVKSRPLRKRLRKRIRAIKELKIREVLIKNEVEVTERFLSRGSTLRPRDARDIAKVFSFIKCHALLNAWNRELSGDSIIANEEDIKKGFGLWEEIAESQQTGIPPYLYRVYREVLVLLCEESKGNGITRKQVLNGYFKKYETALTRTKLRQEFIPMWEAAGLIEQEEDPNDKRKKRIRCKK